MDCRITLNENETFLNLLKACYHSKEKVRLLADMDGITRVEGSIVNIDDSDGLSQYIELDNEIKIPVKKIIAVNGVFLSEFSEC